MTGALSFFAAGAAFASGLASGFSGLVLATAILSSPGASCEPISRYWACAEARARERATGPKVLPGFTILPRRYAQRGEAPRLFLQREREIARMQVVEHGASALIEHVGIEIVGTQERDLALQVEPLGARTLDLAREARLLLREVLLRLQPMRARVGRKAEVADDERRDGIEAERGQDGAQARAG